MSLPVFKDWGEASECFDEIKLNIEGRDLSDANEAQTRFDIIDRFIKEVLCWRHGQIDVEVPNDGERFGYIDYLLQSGDNTIVIEAKKIGAAFPTPSKKAKLKLSGSVLGSGDIGRAIRQAEEYAITKNANFVIVTNGLCWCFYSLLAKDDSSYASLLFPFSIPGHANQLFEIFAVAKVENNSLERISNKLPIMEDRLSSIIRNPDGRVDRNNIADFIMPALDQALYSDALLTNVEHLEKCFVSTEARTKFDTTLGIHLADPKPDLRTPIKRIKRSKQKDHLDNIINDSLPSYAPPVTLFIGPVGAGKSTYLKHFELISGKKLLQEKKAHWIYIDFEEMGKEGNPRKFIYSKLQKYLLNEHPENPTDFENMIAPAYANEFAALARGPFALDALDRDNFNKVKAEYIRKDYEAVEPYIDKVFCYIARKQLCVLVLDNIDLYEDDALETSVFAEGLALSKRLFCNVFVSIRDKTFVRHQSDSTFDAYDLRKLWLDSPPLREVLSSRLSYSKMILAGKSAKITYINGMQLVVPDLSVFFDIVQRSILSNKAGDYIEYISDLNIRRGISLVKNFLTSGHIQADKALNLYLDGELTYAFPFHEVFKGTMLGQWLHFREDRSEGINIFDSRLSSRKLRLLRFLILNELLDRAQSEKSLEVPVGDCIQIFTKCGASEEQIIACLEFLYEKGLVRNITAENVSIQSTIVITKSGGYYVRVLSRHFVYVEECMYDTAIDDAETWQQLSELTYAIESESSIPNRMTLRRERIKCFLDYLYKLEVDSYILMGKLEDETQIPMFKIRPAVLWDADDAVFKTRRRANADSIDL